MKQKGIVVTVVVPIFDRQEMLDELLESIPDRSDIEVVVVDDGSEEFPVVRREFGSTAVRVVGNSPGAKYAGMARNRGIDLAGGEWIAFLDSDDKVDREAFSDLVDFLLENRSDDVVLSYSDCFNPWGSKGRRNEATDWIVGHVERTGDIRYLAHYSPPWGKFVRRVFLKDNDIRFDADRVSNDVMYSARLAAADPRMTVFPRIVTLVRDGHERLTGMADPRSIGERLDVLRRMNAFYRSKGMGEMMLPAWGQLHKLRRHPVAMVCEMAKTLGAGQPLFVTYIY